MKTTMWLACAVVLLLAASLIMSCSPATRQLTVPEKQSRIDSLYHANQIRVLTDQMRGR